MVKIERRGDVFLIYIDRVLSLQSMKDFVEALKSIEKNEGPTAIVLTSTYEKHWILGLDIKEVRRIGPKHMITLMEYLCQVLITILTLGVPVVASINGLTLAGGCLVALACDYRVMNDGTAYMQMNELLGNLVTPDKGCRLIKAKVPPNVYKDMLLRTRKLYGKECLEYQMIDVLSNDTLDEAIKLAKTVSRFGKNKELYKATKNSVYRELIHHIATGSLREEEATLNIKAFTPKL